MGELVDEAAPGVAALVSEAKAQQELEEQQILLSEKRQRSSVIVAAEAERRAIEARNTYERLSAEVRPAEVRMSLRSAAKASTSSKNRTAGACCRAYSKKCGHADTGSPCRRWQAHSGRYRRATSSIPAIDRRT